MASARRGLIIQGGAMLRAVSILYRSALLPISEDGTTIDHVLGATNYRLLRDDEELMSHVIFRTQWI